MQLETLSVQGLRNLAATRLTFGARLNALHGDNGSGKTSLLEALYLLSCARSFRTSRLQHVLGRDASAMTLFAQLRGDDGRRIPLGIEYRERQLKMKAAGQVLKRASDLATMLPMIAIHQESSHILTHGPRYRRRFLDWGVFHVEQDFLPQWRRYSRALKQRNHALQHRVAAPEHIWDSELVDSAAVLHHARQAYLDAFVPLFADYVQRLLRLDEPVSIDYHPGWPAGEDLATVLQAGREQDRQCGYTRRGPHRADLVFRVGKTPLQEYVSRGQLKQVVYALHLAQGGVFLQRTDRGCVFLVDDVNAELDRHHIGLIMTLLEQLRAQVFATTTDIGLLAPYLGADSRVFHVEQGTVREVDRAVG